MRWGINCILMTATCACAIRCRSTVPIYRYIIILCAPRRPEYNSISKWVFRSAEPCELRPQRVCRLGFHDDDRWKRRCSEWFETVNYIMQVPTTWRHSIKISPKVRIFISPSQTGVDSRGHNYTVDIRWSHRDRADFISTR